MNITPCFGCEDRTSICHAKCEMYIAWSDERRRIIAEREGDRAADDVTARAVAKANRRRHLAKKK